MISIIRHLIGWALLGASSNAVSLPNYCHGVEFVLVRIDTSEEIYSRLWLSGTDFDWSPASPVPLEPGSYRATAQISSAASSSSGLPQRGCALLNGEMAFSLDLTPSTIAQTRFLNVRSTVRDDDGPGFFSNDPVVLDGGAAFEDHRINTAQSAVTRGHGYSRPIGIGTGGSGFEMGLDAHVNVADNFSGTPPRASGVNAVFTQWDFELTFPSLWNLRSSADVSTTPGLSPYFGIAPVGGVFDDESVILIFTTDVVEAWIAPPVVEGAVVLPQSPIELEAITLPPADINRGQPYRLRLGTDRSQTDLGVFDAGESVDLVALTGSAVGELFVEPTLPPDPDAPAYLPLKLVLSGTPGTVHVAAHSAPLELVFRDGFEGESSND